MRTKYRVNDKVYVLDGSGVKVPGKIVDTREDINNVPTYLVKAPGMGAPGEEWLYDDEIQMAERTAAADHPLFYDLDPDQESMANDILMIAANEGAFYPQRDYAGAVKHAIRTYINIEIQRLHEDAEIIQKLLVKALRHEWT